MGLILLLCTLCGCSMFKRSEPDFGEMTVYVPTGEPQIVSGLTLKVAVTASGAETVTASMAEVNANGEILLPLIGAVGCEGLTIIELQDKIKEAYKDYYIEPQVTVSFAYVENAGMKSPWGSVLMMGEIARPGPVNMPSTRDLTVTRAVMLAGGATALANKSKIRVTRREEDGSLKRFTVNIEKIGKEGRSDLDLALKPGDVVWIPESWY